MRQIEEFRSAAFENIGEKPVRRFHYYFWESDRADLRFVEAGAVNALEDFRGNEFFDTC